MAGLLGDCSNLLPQKISSKLCRTNSSFLHLHTWSPEDNDGFRSGCAATVSASDRGRKGVRPFPINFILVPPNAPVVSDSIAGEKPTFPVTNLANFLEARFWIPSLFPTLSGDVPHSRGFGT